MKAPRHLQNKIKDWTRFRKKGALPKWHFPEMPSAAHLRFDLLGYDNYLNILEMFQKDTSEFVEAQFKSLDRLEDYIIWLKEVAPYSGKRAAVDWLLRNEEGQCIGLAHLHDLSLESLDQNYLKASIGYLVAEPFRRRGYGSEVALHLCDYAFAHFDLCCVLAYTKIDNAPSRGLLKKAGFQSIPKDAFNIPGYEYYEMTQSRFYQLYEGTICGNRIDSISRYRLLNKI